MYLDLSLNKVYANRIHVDGLKTGPSVVRQVLINFDFARWDISFLLT